MCSNVPKLPSVCPLNDLLDMIDGKGECAILLRFSIDSKIVSERTEKVSFVAVVLLTVKT